MLSIPAIMKYVGLNRSRKDCVFGIFNSLSFHILFLPSTWGLSQNHSGRREGEGRHGKGRQGKGRKTGTSQNFICYWCYLYCFSVLGGKIKAWRQTEGQASPPWHSTHNCINIRELLSSLFFSKTMSFLKLKKLVTDTSSAKARKLGFSTCLTEAFILIF